MRPLLPGIAFRAHARTRGARSAAPTALGTGFAPGDVEAAAPGYPFAGFFGIEGYRRRHRRFDGRMSPPLERSVFVSGDAATVLPFDIRRDTVLLLETVAGRCDPLEAPEATARREAREEAGLELGRLERVAAYYSSPGIAAEHITAFVGEADLSAAGGTHGMADEHEDIRALVVPLDAALEAVASGEINNAPLLVTLLWLARHRERLAAAWTAPGP